MLVEVKVPRLIVSALRPCLLIRVMILALLLCVILMTLWLVLIMLFGLVRCCSIMLLISEWTLAWVNRDWVALSCRCSMALLALFGVVDCVSMCVFLVRVCVTVSDLLVCLRNRCVMRLCVVRLCRCLVLCLVRVSCVLVLCSVVRVVGWLCDLSRVRVVLVLWMWVSVLLLCRCVMMLLIPMWLLLVMSCLVTALMTLSFMAICDGALI